MPKEEKFILCPTCEGTGKVLTEAFRGVAVEQDLVDDEDFMRSYLGGDYDVPCNECGGLRVVNTNAQPSEKGASGSYCCGERMRECSEQEYPGAYIHRWKECRNPDCEED